MATIPATTLALIFGKAIKAYLFNPIAMASAFIVGSFVTLWAERRECYHGETRDSHANVLLEVVKADVSRIEMPDDLRIFDAIKVGFAQCLALIPGTSRFDSTIIGGLLSGLPRKVATEFPLFLAIPATLGVTVYGLYRSHVLPLADDLSVFAVGFVAVFVSVFFCMCQLLKLIATHDSRGFAWHRIIFGIVVLVMVYTCLIA